MNKRSFFKSLGLLAAGAAVAPSIFIPKFEPVRWKILRPTRAVINPEWVRAKYEMSDTLNVREYRGERKRDALPFPYRGNELDSNGRLIPIAPYILV